MIYNQQRHIERINLKFVLLEITLIGTALYFTFLDSTLVGFTFFRKNKSLTGQSFLQPFLVDLISILNETIKQLIKFLAESFCRIAKKI